MRVSREFLHFTKISRVGRGGPLEERIIQKFNILA